MASLKKMMSINNYRQSFVQRMRIASLKHDFHDVLVTAGLVNLLCGNLSGSICTGMWEDNLKLYQQWKLSVLLSRFSEALLVIRFR